MQRHTPKQRKGVWRVAYTPYKVLIYTLFKTPHSPYRECIVLIVLIVVLVAIVEVLIPRVVAIVLRRAPVVVISKSTHNVR